MLRKSKHCLQIDYIFLMEVSDSMALSGIALFGIPRNPSQLATKSNTLKLDYDVSFAMQKKKQSVC